MTQRELELKYKCRIRFYGEFIYANVSGRTASAHYVGTPSEHNSPDFEELRKASLLKMLATFLEAEA